MGGHGHDGAGAVVAQHVVADPDRDALLGDGVDGERAGEDAAHLLDFGLPLALGAVLGPRHVCLHLSLLLRGGDMLNHLVLRTQDHERHTEDGVRAGGEYLEGSLTLDPLDIAAHIDLLPIQLTLFGQRKPYGCTLASANPVALNLLQRVCPIDLFEALEQTLGIRGDAQDPLSHLLAFHGEAATYGESVHHLIVGEHGAELRTPVHPRVGEVGQTIVHQDFLTFLLGSTPPLFRGKLHRLGLRHVQPFGAVGCESLLQLGNRTGLIGLVAVVAVEQLDERPLRPLVVVGVASLERAVPVEREADLVELLAVALDVLLGGDGGMLAGLDGILLRRKPESVVTHRVQHVVALLTFVAGVDIGGDIAQRVSHMQSRARRVREHVQHVKLRLRVVYLCLIQAGLFPGRLPFLLYFSKVVFH